jgi:transcription antitermination factor NusG
VAEALPQIQNAALPAQTPWIAIKVRAQLERSIQDGLTQQGLETFVPWYGVRRRWVDRVKTIHKNLLPGYVFCRSTFADRRAVMSQPGVAFVVSFNRIPAPIPDAEIETLRRAVDSGMRMGPWPFLKLGQRVRIERGALSGIEGVLVRNANAWNLVVSVDALQRSIAVEVERDMVRPL